MSSDTGTNQIHSGERVFMLKISIDATYTLPAYALTGAVHPRCPFFKGHEQASQHRMQ
jgi:hypothetical protein